MTKGIVFGFLLQGSDIFWQKYRCYFVSPEEVEKNEWFSTANYLYDNYSGQLNWNCAFMIELDYDNMIGKKIVGKGNLSKSFKRKLCLSLFFSFWVLVECVLHALLYQLS